jgi:uncharacterized protein YegP (UPF0339 family)
MSAKFEIEKAADGHFYFHLKAANGQIIFSSQQYKAKASAQAGIDSVKENALIAAHFERKTSTSGQPYFILKAGNGETLGRSQMYSTTAAMEKGIESVQTNAPTAHVEDLTHDS